MLKVKYPTQECPNYEDLYYEVFFKKDSTEKDSTEKDSTEKDSTEKTSTIQDEWKSLRQNNSALQDFPEDLSKILLAKYEQLVEFYKDYAESTNSLSDEEVKNLNKELEKVFNYDKWYDEIAQYFMDPTHGFDFSTCHYCDMAYVNAYKIDAEKDALLFLNTASKKELTNKLDLCDKSIEKIYNHPPFESPNEFDEFVVSLGCKPNKFDRTFNPTQNMRRHFDIEHVLPKSICPLVGLSLYNFVPSCQVCNSKLKKTRVLGKYGIPELKLSPTSDKYDFDDMVKFKLVPGKECKLSAYPTKDRDNYRLDLDTSLDPDYDYNVQLFKLRERYDYHKMEALHWLEMKYQYSDSRIEMLASIFDDPLFEFHHIKEAIFQSSLDKSHHRVFGKMKKDILG